MAQAKKPGSMGFKSKTKKTPKKPAPQKARQLDKSKPADVEGKAVIQVHVSKEKRNEIKLFAMSHGYSVKDLMLLGYDTIKEKLEAADA